MKYALLTAPKFAKEAERIRKAAAAAASTTMQMKDKRIAK